MRTEPERHDEALVDAALGGEPWADLQAEVKRMALAAFRARQRRRRALLRVGRLAACFLAMAGAAWWWHIPPRAVPQAQMSGSSVPGGIVAAASSPWPLAPKLPAGPYLSEEEMLALFPPGSCVIAEIDGERQLVFLDPKIAAEGAPLRRGS